MASFDYDVVIIGSGFGGSVAALRAAEKGYRVGVMESGRRWRDEDIPKTQWDLPHFLWMPAAELYGIQRIEYLDDVLILSGAGVGGGSHVYANTLYVPPKQFFDAPEWSGITDRGEELAPHLDQASRMLGVVRYAYMPTDVDRVLQEVASEIGRAETFSKAPVGVYFGDPGVEGQVLGFDDARHWSERTVIMLCMQTTDTSIELFWHDGLLHSRHSATPPPVYIPVIEDFVDRVATKLDSGEGALLFEAINRNASAHFVGGTPIGESSDSGAVDPYLRLFGQPGLHVMDGSVMPANPGVNPSLTITALSERAMSLWPNKGDADIRPPLGTGYERIDPVLPHRPAVPAGAPAELRLDAEKADVIPAYPY